MKMGWREGSFRHTVFQVTLREFLLFGILFTIEGQAFHQGIFLYIRINEVDTVSTYTFSFMRRTFLCRSPQQYFIIAPSPPALASRPLALLVPRGRGRGNQFYPLCKKPLIYHHFRIGLTVSLP